MFIVKWVNWANVMEQNYNCIIWTDKARIVRHIDQRVRVKGNLFAPKCSYANIPYVQCSETLIISSSCVFLLPLPFELKFWFFEFEYVAWREVQIEGFIWILSKIMVALLTIKWLIGVEKVNWSSNHVICILVGMVIWTSTSAMSSFPFLVSTCSK